MSAQNTMNFFRILGGGSKVFGEIQDENAIRLVEVNSLLCHVYNYTHHQFLSATDTWIVQVFSGSFDGKDSYLNSFKVSSGEVRPRNKAVCIWKRTE
jgi:hypothetical protein